MTNQTDAKARITCKRCNGTGMAGPVVVYQGRCFGCDGIGWNYKGELSKAAQARKDNRAILAAQEKARLAELAAAACTGVQRNSTVHHFDWEHKMTFESGKVFFMTEPDCLVCTQELLPSEALAIFFA